MKMLESDTKEELISMLADIRSRVAAIEGALVAVSVPPGKGKRGQKRKENASSDLNLVTVAPEKNPQIAVTERIKIVLSKESLAAEDVAKQIGVPQKKVVQEMATLFKDGHLVCVMGRGDGARYRWSSSIRPENVARRELIKQLLMERPMSQTDLRAVIKGDPKLVDDAVTEIRRTEMVWIMNKGTSGHRNQYMIFPNRMVPPPESDGRLPPKLYKPKDEAAYKPRKKPAK